VSGPEGTPNGVDRLAPDVLSGDEGESIFVRHDLAENETAARASALREGYSTDGYEAAVVEMLPVPEHFTGIDHEWATVHPGTPEAVKYWRFRV